MVNFWSSLQKYHATTPEEILTQPIRHNNFIKIGNTTFFYKTWCENGIFFIKDIINNNGNFFSLEQLNAKYNVRERPFDFYGGGGGRKASQQKISGCDYREKKFSGRQKKFSGLR